MGPEDPHYGTGPVPPGAYAVREPRPGPPAPEELAEWWRRAVSLLVDGVILGAITLALVLLVGGGLYAGGDVSATEAVIAALGTVAVFAFVVLLYAPLLMARTNGQTVGRMVAGCRVVRTDGKPVGFAYAAVREVAVKGLLLGIAGAATGGIAYVVDGVWPLVDPENRALHDYLVDSRVVKTGG